MATYNSLVEHLHSHPLLCMQIKSDLRHPEKVNTFGNNQNLVNALIYIKKRYQSSRLVKRKVNQSYSYNYDLI